MKNMIIMIIISTLLTYIGCSNQQEGSDVMQFLTKNPSNNEDIPCGGTTNNSDYNAPKVINSNTITKFKVGFFHEGEFDSSGDRYFTFEIAPDENGKLILKDSYDDPGMEVDQSVLDGVQAIIKEYNLASLNGIDRHTAGLPPEFETCYLNVVYDSGEQINYSENSDPGADWSAAIRDYFANIYAEHGDDKYLPPKETGMVTRFEMEYVDGDVYHKYGEILLPNKEITQSFEELVEHGGNEEDYDLRIWSESWLREENAEVEDLYALPSDEYYDKLSEIINNSDLRKLENNEGYPNDFDYDNSKGFYTFYVEYDYGNRMSGFSDDPKDYELFMSIADELVRYIDNYIEENKVDK